MSQHHESAGTALPAGPLPALPQAHAEDLLTDFRNEQASIRLLVTRGPSSWVLGFKRARASTPSKRERVPVSKRRQHQPLITMEGHLSRSGDARLSLTSVLHCR